MWRNWIKFIQILLASCLLCGNLAADVRVTPRQSNLQTYLLQMALDEPASQVRVIIQTTQSTQYVQKIVQQLGGKIVQDLSMIHAIAVELPARAVPVLANEPQVRWISLDAPVQSSELSGDAQFDVGDDFNVPRYDGNDGTQSWLTPWQEIGENDGPQVGDVVVTDFFGGALQGLRIQNLNRGAQRMVDLRGAEAATLTIAYRRKDFTAADSVVLQASTDGGDTWVDLFHITGAATDAEIQYASLDMGTFTASQTAIRFLSESLTPDAKFYLDSIKVQATQSNADANSSTKKVYLPLVVGSNSATAEQATQPMDKQEAIRSGEVSAAATCTYYCFDLTKLQSTFDKAIGADQIWNVSPYLRGYQVGVAVVDSGITPHPDLQDYSGVSRIVKQVQFGSAAGSVDDYYGHGTHIAGTIGGLGTRSNGVYVGVAPEAKLIDVKVINDYGYGSTSDVVAGLQWIYNNRTTYNIKVANLSLNSTVPESYHNSPLDAALEILWFNRITVVVSAGNRGSQHLYPPANDPFAITVGAVDDKGTTATTDDTLAPFSAFGVTESGFSKPDILAPGTNIVQALASDDSNLARDHGSNKVTAATGYNYFKMSGTSMAAAVVSGAIADLLEDEPNLTPDQIKYRLKATARPISSSSACSTGAGELDLYAAIFGTTTASANLNIQASQLLWSGSSPITWSSVNWNSVNWNSVNWNSVNWNSVNWNSVNWNNSVWDSAVWNSVSAGNTSSTCMGVTSMTLVNADTNRDVQPFFPGAVLDLRTIGTTNLSVRATVVGTNASAYFDLDNGSYSKMENSLPYALAGDDGLGDYAGVNFTMGSHTLRVSPYTLVNGGGSIGNSMSVPFVVATSLQAVHSSKCMDVPNASLANAVQLTQSSCVGGKKQLFEVRAIPSKVNRYNLINTNSQMCMDVSNASATDAAAIIQYPCTGNLNQEFELRTVGTSTNIYNLIASHSGKCVDVNGASTSDGAALIQWSCNGGTNQQWRLLK